MSKNKKLPKGYVDNSEDRNKQNLYTGIGLSATNSARISTQKANVTYSKPSTYNRKLYDSGSAKTNVKKQSFNKGIVKDPYTGETLVLTKAEAKLKYGDNWQNHLAEGDHIVSIKETFQKNKNNPWLKNEDIKNAVNSKENMQTVSRKYNNAKRDRSNEKFVNDKEYLEKTGVKITKEGKNKAIEAQKTSEKSINKTLRNSTVGNIVKTGHEAGVLGAKNGAGTGLTVSGIMNITAVIKGEKEPLEAISDTLVDGGKGAVTGYIMGGGLTVLSHSLTNSSSKFISTLIQSNVPGKIITGVTITWDALKNYINGDITLEECILKIGENGLNVITGGISMTIGQVIIPIPVIGAAIGALVGSLLTSGLYSNLINTLQKKQLEHEKRLRIIAECEILAREEKEFRDELEYYLEEYFKEYRSCFDSSLSQIKTSLKLGDANGIISGANKITRKLGGNVYYETIDEFIDFLDDESTIDIL